MPTFRMMRAAVWSLAAAATLLSPWHARAQAPYEQQSPYAPQGQYYGGPQGGAGYAAPGYGAPPQTGAPTYGYGGAQPSYDGYANSPPVNPGYATPPSSGAYSPNAGYGSGGYDAYSPGDRYSATPPSRDSFSDPGQPYDGSGGGYGYGEPYTPPPPGDPEAGVASGKTYEQGEIISAGHQFFGSISKGLASAVEYAFRNQGRPNGYILGEDAGGAFVLGFRYGEGRLFTKDAGDHKIYWQGPSVGYDAGAEGSKTMVLVYNLRDPSEIYNRFGGVQGSAYLVGGVSIQFQKHNDVTLGIIRSGVGVRLGANVGYLKYTRSPTWNPL